MEKNSLESLEEVHTEHRTGARAIQLQTTDASLPSYKIGVWLNYALQKNASGAFRKGRLTTLDTQTLLLQNLSFFIKARQLKLEAKT